MRYRPINFQAGPGQLSTSVLAEASIAMTNFNNTGMSICEISHFSNEWHKLYEDTIKVTREFLKIPTDYYCFYMNGGATHQFASLFYNLCDKKSKIQVLVTGYWSHVAANEFEKFCSVSRVKNEAVLVDSPEFTFTYYCENETGSCFEFKNGLHFSPKNHFLVSDMSSILGGKHIDFTKYGVIFSSLSKNLGITGASLVILSDKIALDGISYPPNANNYNDLTLGTPNPKAPIAMDWYYFSNKLGPTPCIFSIYITYVNIRNMINKGGIDYYHKQNLLKSDLLYKYLDSSEGFYQNMTNPKNRSRTNINFLVDNSQDISKEFVEKAKQNGIIGLEHHPFDPLKGCRVSLYNSINLEDIDSLINFMNLFKGVISTRSPRAFD